ncbi:MAG: 5-formyltetrahydrofolate cyclo-ligase [Candidatus Saccharimonadales bacterium]
MNEKAVLRTTLKQLRLGINEKDRKIKSDQVCHLLESLDLSGINRLHFYMPILSMGEVDILPYIESIKRAYPHIELFTNKKIDGAWKNIAAFNGSNSYEANYDMILVPMLGFDERLHRVGYGGGHYDKFLKAQSSAKKIGVCFDACRVDKIPDELHDIKLDKIVTETKVYSE